MTQAAFPRQKIQRRPVHGVLLLDKPLGLSSNQALQRVKWLLRAEKAGHTGTLDPLATGVLPLCFGAATKFSQMQLDANKTYEATLLLGQKTSTGDAEGTVLQTRPVPKISEAMLQPLTAQFTGSLRQTPPMYSALKHDGKALYEYARAGQEVERQAREIQIFSLKMAVSIDKKGQDAIKIEVHCSKGTYIRTLGEDIGEALGCGAHLGALRRIETGSFTQAQCITLPALEAMTESEREACLLPVDSLVAAYPSVRLPGEQAGRFLSGLRRRGEPDQWGVHIVDPPALVRVYGCDPDAFLGTAHITAHDLIPQRLLSPLEVQAVLQTHASLVERPTCTSAAM